MVLEHRTVWPCREIQELRCPGTIDSLARRSGPLRRGAPGMGAEQRGDVMK